MTQFKRGCERMDMSLFILIVSYLRHVEIVTEASGMVVARESNRSRNPYKKENIKALTGGVDNE